jgi:KIF-1 binding protein C terminal
MQFCFQIFSLHVSHITYFHHFLRRNLINFTEIHLLTFLSFALSIELLGGDEVRPFLNAHFLSCRALSKILPSSSTAVKKRATGLVAALKRNEWLMKSATSLCEKKGISVDTVFEEERSICCEMVALLPSKIDRVHYRGEVNLLS